jgi:23S rRNA (adenine2503-C2)-methyltransferase
MTLAEIADTGIMWHEMTGRNPFFNYCAHKGNTSDEDADRLHHMFDPTIWECTISVICEKDETVRDATLRQRAMANDFSSRMLQRGFNVRVFDPAGQDDIGGGCGQLWHTQQWMKENPTKIKSHLKV